MDQLRGGIPSGVSIEIEFKIATDKFKLLQFNPNDKEKYALNLSQIGIHIPVATINAALYKQIEDDWSKKQLNLYFDHLEVRKFTCNTGTLHKKIDNFLQNTMPVLLLVGIVPSKAADGSYDTNPFSFKKFFSKQGVGFTVNRESDIRQKETPLFANDPNSLYTYLNDLSVPRELSKIMKSKSPRRKYKMDKNAKKNKRKIEKLSNKLRKELSKNKAGFMYGNGPKKRRAKKSDKPASLFSSVAQTLSNAAKAMTSSQQISSASSYSNLDECNSNVETNNQVKDIENAQNRNRVSVEVHSETSGRSEAIQSNQTFDQTGSSVNRNNVFSNVRASGPPVDAIERCESNVHNTSNTNQVASNAENENINISTQIESSVAGKQLVTDKIGAPRIKRKHKSKFKEGRRESDPDYHPDSDSESSSLSSMSTESLSSMSTESSTSSSSSSSFKANSSSWTENESSNLTSSSKTAKSKHKASRRRPTTRNATTSLIQTNSNVVIPAHSNVSLLPNMNAVVPPEFQIPPNVQNMSPTELLNLKNYIDNQALIVKDGDSHRRKNTSRKRTEKKKRKKRNESPPLNQTRPTMSNMHFQTPAHVASWLESTCRPYGMNQNSHDFVPQAPQPFAGDFFYIESMELLVNGKSIDSLTQGKSSKFDSVFEFSRFLNVTGYKRSQATCGISYDDFLDDYYMLAFNLSRQISCGESTFYRPTTLYGTLELQLKFSEPTTYDLTMFTFAKYDAYVTISKDRVCGHSFMQTWLIPP